MQMIPTGYTIFRADLDHIADHLKNDAKTLCDKHVFITGGTGFFGIWLLEGLLWLNEKYSLNIRITVLSRSPKDFLSKKAPHLKDKDNLNFISGKVTDFDYPTVPCTHIIHAASETNLEISDDWAHRHLDAAIEGTKRLLDLASKHGSEAVLITTSGAVYSSMDFIIDDFCVEGPSSVTDYISERIVYGQSKRIMEVMTSCAAHKYGFDAKIARCFAFVGPYLPLESNYAIGNFIRDALSGREIVVGGDGTPMRSYLYAADLVIWLIRILVSGKSGMPYNVGGAEVVSIRELAHLVAKVADNNSVVSIKGTPVPGSKPSAYLPSLKRVIDELHLRSEISLEEAIKRTIAWHRMRSSRQGY